MRLTARSPMLAAVLLALPGAAVAAPQDSGSAPKPSSWVTLCNRDVEAIDVVIDANTGRKTRGSVRYKQNDSVTLAFVNKNPFRYEYRFDYQIVAIDEATVDDFINAFFTVDLSRLLGDGPAEVPPPGDESACGINTDVRAAFDAAFEAFRAIDTEVRDAVQQYDTAAPLIDEFVALTGQEQLECSIVGTKADALLPLLEPLEALDVLDVRRRYATAVTAVGAAHEKLKAAIDARVVSNPGEEQPCALQLAKRTSRNEEAAAAGTAFEDVAEAVEKTVGQAKRVREAILRVGADPNSFIHIMPRPIEATEPSGARVSILRRERKPNAQWSRTQSVTIQLGHGRLSVSTGIGVSSVDDVRIVRQAASVDGPGSSGSGDGGGARTVGNVFGYSTNSSFKPQLVAMLNGHIGEVFGGGYFALSIGAALSNRADKAAVEFMLGPSLGLLDNRVFITVAFQAARVESLAEGTGFEIGDPVPEGLADPLPVQRDWKPGLMVSLSYRIR